MKQLILSILIALTVIIATANINVRVDVITIKSAMPAEEILFCPLLWKWI